MTSRQTLEIQVYKRTIHVLQRYITDDNEPIFLARSTYPIDAEYILSKSLGGWNGWILAIINNGQYANYYVDIDDIKITIED